MRLSIKTRQVAGVTLLVGFTVFVLSLLHLLSLVRISLVESQSRAEMLANTIYQRAHDIALGGSDLHTAMRMDPGMRSILEASIYSKNVISAAIVDRENVAIAHSLDGLEDEILPPEEDLATVLTAGALEQVRAAYSARNLEVRLPLELEGEEFGSIRVGISALLIRDDLREALKLPAVTAVVALLIGMIGAMLLSQWMLRPIHVIRTGLSRLGRGEFGLTLDLPPGEEFGELTRSFNTLSARLSAERDRLSGQSARFESVVERLEDAVAMFDPEGELLFANAGMRASLVAAERGRHIASLLPPTHPYRLSVEETLATRRSRGPVTVTMPAEGGGTIERLLLTHAITDSDHRFIGVMVVVRNLEYLAHVQSTLNYSRKLAAFGRLMAGVAHEVKNPLNAMTIHLELVKQKLQTPARRRLPALANPGSGSPVAERRPGSTLGLLAEPTRTPSVVAPEASGAVDVPAVMKHVAIISDEIRRLDEVVQGLLKFTRPEELTLQPLPPGSLIEEVVQVVAAEAQKSNVVVRTAVTGAVPPINVDPTMMRQALLNLALNACQAMPDGGTLTLSCGPAEGGRVEIAVADSGVGISPDHLDRIFDLYFTTKEHGSGIGLSMVYRIVQLHDGEVEVESTPGHGTVFRLLLPQQHDTHQPGAPA
jgi:signal transduction histidine kinase/HAMP domain-containing protein